MSNIPANLQYTDSHEWVRIEKNNEVTVGITAHAQQLLGKLVYVELPNIGSTVQVGAEVGVVESVKAASDIYSPLTGEVVAINKELEAHPDYVNTDPYVTGWMYRLKLTDNKQIQTLLSSEDYTNGVEGNL